MPLGLALAAAPQNIYPPFHLIGLFLVGAFVMRGAGCTFNDIADRHIDAQVRAQPDGPSFGACFGDGGRVFAGASPHRTGRAVAI